MRMGMRVVMPVTVIMAVSVIMAMRVAMGVILIRANAAHMVVMSGLNGADIAFISQSLFAIFTHLAVHRRLSAVQFIQAIEEGIDHQRMVTQIRRLKELGPGVA